VTDPKKIIGKTKGNNQTLEEKDDPDAKIDEMPDVPDKPEIDKLKPKRAVPNSMDDLKDIMKSITDTNVQDINDTLEKNLGFEKAARDLWIVKMSEKPFFEIKMKVPIKEGKKVIGYQRDKEGKPVYTSKKFYYGGIGIPEKDLHANLLMEREYAKFELSQTALKIKVNPTPDLKIKFMEQSQEIYRSVQKYNVQVFKDYFGATDDEINLMNIDDIINYNDVAVYIEGTRHPQ
jgi:hypothetical protein